MSIMSAMSLSKTLLDCIAEDYWQDFLMERPMAGVIAYEAELHDCQLDESLASLKRVDTLLSRIRRDITKSHTMNEMVPLTETVLLADERYCNLLIFLAFYAGRVLARQWQSTPHWYGQFELTSRYPELPFIPDDFYQHIAVVYCDDCNQDLSDQNLSRALFFALEPIGLRLFGHIDRPFEAIQGGPLASGLYQAVSVRLPETATDIMSTASNTSTALTSQSNQPIVNKSKNEFADKEVIAKTAPSSLKAAPTPEIFIQLLIELNEIEVPQTAGHDDYQQACKILDQFERHIAKQHKPRNQVTFLETHQAARQQALNLLQNAATLGNTAAMLRLAMYELLGEGLAADEVAGKNIGVNWIKQAASAKDNRAQRLLSKMYYQGIGVPQDIDNGKDWLGQAAENGHLEAASIAAQWQQAQMLITTQKQEQHSIKRYQLLIGVILIAALLLLLFV
ncbi:tetratricopeptide repeat protein [Psychrobacter sp. CAL346-MNA-CIBAN-0220]|uniref:tetratricopeptide repeat protein n=1 Tax=Psychrobacter sp. CAL346-MNA-CIBAN-0220 TaxID=3140457 RepID=UPI0033198704